MVDIPKEKIYIYFIYIYRESIWSEIRARVFEKSSSRARLFVIQCEQNIFKNKISCVNCCTALLKYIEKWCLIMCCISCI